MNHYTFANWRGDPILMFIQHDLPLRRELCQLIAHNGGDPSSSASDATYLIVDPDTDTRQDIIEEYGNNPKQIVLSQKWIPLSINARHVIISEGWGGCRLGRIMMRYNENPSSTSVSAAGEIIYLRALLYMPNRPRLRRWTRIQRTCHQSMQSPHLL